MIIRHLNGCLKNISVTKLGTLHLFRLLPWKWSKAAPLAKGAEGGACLGQLVDVEWTNFCLMFKNKEDYIVIKYHITTSTKLRTYNIVFINASQEAR